MTIERKHKHVYGRLLSNETEGCLSKLLNKASSTTPPPTPQGQNLSHLVSTVSILDVTSQLHITSNCT